jgi:serine protease inhibitor
MWLLAAAPAVLMAAASLASAADPKEAPAAASGSPKESQAGSSGNPKEAAPAVAANPTNANDLMPAQSLLALHLVDKLGAKQPGGNVVVSPASLAGALAVIELGADAKLQADLHALLGFDKKSPEWADFELLRRATGSSSEGGPLSTANAIVFDAKSKPYPQAVASLTRSDIKVTVADFADPKTLADINEWVSQHTKGKIPSILDELPRDAALVALNAIYFKDKWKQTFDAKETQSAPFHLVGGSTVDVPLMHAGDRRFSFRQDARYIAVDLPYATQGFSLVAVTTKGAPAAAAEFAKLNDWLIGSGFSEAPGEVALPRFGATANLDLMPTLAELGFKGSTALPKFAPGPLRLAKAQQRVELKVDEEGTEAAAATAVAGTRSLDGNYVKAVFDKPFVFALRDTTTGLIVVAGYVAKPEATESNPSAKPASN